MADDIQALCAKWQTLLRLRDWNVDVQLTDKAGLKEYHAGADDGVCLPCPEGQTAQIRLLHPDHADSVTDRVMNYDLEGSLVHELIHLKMNYHSPRAGSQEEVAREWAINSLTEALLLLDRKEKV